MANRIIEIECSCCSDCPYYIWKEQQCSKGATEGPAEDPFYSDCPLSWRESDGNEAD